MTDGGSPVNLSAALPFMAGRGADPAFSRWQLDPRDVIELLEHALKGLPPLWRKDLVELDRDAPRTFDLGPGSLQRLGGPLERLVDLLVAGPIVTVDGAHAVIWIL